MGGNALSCASVRLAKRAYERVARDCVSKLRALYPGKRIEALGSYRSKADFGDCDILVEGGESYDPHAAAAALVWRPARRALAARTLASPGARAAAFASETGVVDADAHQPNGRRRRRRAGPRVPGGVSSPRSPNVTVWRVRDSARGSACAAAA